MNHMQHFKNLSTFKMLCVLLQIENKMWPNFTEKVSFFVGISFQIITPCRYKVNVILCVLVVKQAVLHFLMDQFPLILFTILKLHTAYL